MAYTEGPMRYRQLKKWNVEGVFKQMDPILEEFKGAIHSTH
jgi:hypothetical protein